MKTGKHHPTVVKPNESRVIDVYVRGKTEHTEYSAVIEPVTDSAVLSTLILAPTVVQVDGKGVLARYLFEFRIYLPEK